MTQEANLLPCSQAGLVHYLASLGKRCENPVLDGVDARLGGAGHRSSRLEVLSDLTGGTILQIEEKEGSPSPSGRSGGVACSWQSLSGSLLTLSLMTKLTNQENFWKKKKTQSSSEVGVVLLK